MLLWYSWKFSDTERTDWGLTSLRRLWRSFLFSHSHVSGTRFMNRHINRENCTRLRRASVRPIGYTGAAGARTFLSDFTERELQLPKQQFLDWTCKDADAGAGRVERSIPSVVESSDAPRRTATKWNTPFWADNVEILSTSGLKWGH